MGFSMFVLKLNPGEDNEALLSVSIGSLGQEMRFWQHLPNTVMLIVYANYDFILEIDTKWHLVMDYYWRMTHHQM